MIAVNPSGVVSVPLPVRLVKQNLLSDLLSEVVLDTDLGNQFKL
ncbi:hypothetical protein Enr17x_06780 [Gimesia fumaroli]|jgi:hypothetical protein|uniref:Uncharacterized protein n=1 Tax=Gimesia fumaroli TaxID=2527976 RepID=A0A518I6F8_9PLAN|nr:hypothetical protein Enr17x_06780 [Gimesia fumaroli]